MIWEGSWYAQVGKAVLALLLIGGFFYAGPWDMGKKLPEWLRKKLRR